MTMTFDLGGAVVLNGISCFSIVLCYLGVLTVLFLIFCFSGAV